MVNKRGVMVTSGKGGNVVRADMKEASGIFAILQNLGDFHQVWLTKFSCMFAG